MYKTIFKIIQPYLLRFLAKHAAEYLESRRERRLKQGQDETSPPESAIASVPQTMAGPTPQAGISSSNAFWYTMSGLLLGSAFGIALAHIIRPED